MRWPIFGPAFNTRDYPSNQLVLSDLEIILRTVLKDKLDIEEKSYKVGQALFPRWPHPDRAHIVQEYSVVLVIPDFYDRFYVQNFVKLLLDTMGFKQLCAQQVGLRIFFLSLVVPIITQTY